MAGGTGAMAMPPRTGQMPDGGAFLAFLGHVAKAFQRNFQPADKAATPKETPLRKAVENALQPLLPSGDAGIDRVARALGVSRQTLYRRLKAEGFTFEQVLDSLRHRLALRYVRGEGMSAKEAAYRLGFSDPAAFSRAFKRWTGRSPSDRR